MSAVATNGDERRAAVQAWLDARSRGERLTGVQLADRFGRSDGWGRARIREARQWTDRATAEGERKATVTAEPETTGDPVPAEPAPTAGVAAVPELAEGGTPEAIEVPGWVGWVTVAAVLAVATAAAVASVEHLADLARLAGETGWRAWLLPAAVDGLVVASSMCLYRAHLLDRPAGLLPWASLGAGLVASVAGNVISVNPDLVDIDTLKIAVGATPPLSLALAFDMALRQTGTSGRIAWPVPTMGRWLR